MSKPPARSAILVRTHFFDDSVARFIAFLRQGRRDVYVVADESEHATDFGEAPKVSMTLQSVGQMGLYPYSPKLFWRCGDYGYYAARQALPHYDAFWLIEPDVAIHAADPDAFFDPLDESPADFLAAMLRPVTEEWNWARTLSPEDGTPWRCLFPLTRLRAPAIDALFEARQTASQRGPVGGDPVLWPNDEAFVATTAQRLGLMCADLNSLGDVYDPETFTYWWPLLERQLQSLPLDGRAYHPVLSGQAYLRKVMNLCFAQRDFTFMERALDQFTGIECTEDEATAHREAVAFAKKQFGLG